MHKYENKTCRPDLITHSAPIPSAVAGFVLCSTKDPESLLYRLPTLCTRFGSYFHCPSSSAVWSGQACIRVRCEYARGFRFTNDLFGYCNRGQRRSDWLPCFLFSICARCSDCSDVVDGLINIRDHHVSLRTSDGLCVSVLVYRFVAVLSQKKQK